MFCFRRYGFVALLLLVGGSALPAQAQQPISYESEAPCGRAALALRPRVDITTAQLNVRSNPSSDSTKVTTLQGGQQFEVLGFAPGEPIAGDETWLLLRLDGRTTGWIAASFASPSLHVREISPALETSDPSLYAAPGRRQRDGSLFWPYRFFWSDPVSNGGCPGFEDGESSDFDSQLAADQMAVLAEEYRIDVVISLACRDHMALLAQRLDRHGRDIPEQESIRLWVRDDYYPRNRATFLRLGELAEDKKLYIHCRHGSHRAVVASMAALIGAHKVESLGDALLQARGQLESFEPGYARPLFRHVVRFALEQGLEVEPEFLEFAGLARQEEVSHAP